MRSVVLICCIALLSAACIDLGFENPQPEGRKDITRIPAKFQGKFTNGEDTLQLRNNWLIAGNDSISIQPSDTLVVRKWKGWYFFNMTESKHSYWTVACARVKGDELVLLLPQIVREDKEFLSRYSEVREIIDHNDNLDAYIISPTRTDWDSILSSKLFAENTFRRIEQEN